MELLGERQLGGQRVVVCVFRLLGVQLGAARVGVERERVDVELDHAGAGRGGRSRRLFFLLGSRGGDAVKVHVKVVEGSRTRVQVFQGVVIARQGGGVSETFTIRKISFGVGVERTFPVHTPTVEKIEVVTRGAVRRAKLYYLRKLRGKAAKIKERRER